MKNSQKSAVGLRVLHLVGDIFNYNGAALQSLRLATELRNLGCESGFFAHGCGAPKGEDSIAGMSVYCTDGGNWNNFFDCYKAIGDFKPDVVHGHGFFLGAMAACRIRRKPVLLKTTLMGVDDLPSLIRRSRLTSAIIRGISGNNALADYIASVNRTVLQHDKVIVIPNGVEIPAPDTLIKESPSLLLVVGTIAPRKRVDRAIELFNAIGQSNSWTRLEILGPITDPDYQKFCLSLVDRSLVDRVIFCGEVAHSVVLERMRSATGLIFGSDREGLPNVVLEAMSHNCVPIIVGEDLGAREAIRRDGGLVVGEIGDFEWEKVQRILESCAPYRVAKECFDIKKTAKMHLDAYSRLA